MVVRRCWAPPRRLRGPRGHGGSPRDRACPGRPSSSTSRTDLRRSRSVDRRTPRRRPRWSGRRRARRLSARAHARGRGRSRRALSEVVALGLRASHCSRGVAGEPLGCPRVPVARFLEAPGPGPSGRPRAVRPARAARTRMRHARAPRATCSDNCLSPLVALDDAPTTVSRPSRLSGPSRPRAARPARTARTRMRYGRAEGATCGSGRWLCIVAY